MGSGLQITPLRAEGSERIVGIDLGTTNSLVAYLSGGAPAVIPGKDGFKLVPSVVAIPDEGEAVVGNDARTWLITQPERSVYSIKRLMGRGLEDIASELKLFPFHIASGVQPGEALKLDLADAFSLRLRSRHSFFASSSATRNGSSTRL